jgi:hypothetical protein
MSIRKSILSVLLLVGTLGWVGAALAQEGVLFKVALTADSDYCHMKFPAIQEETLLWDRPVLKDPSEGDLIDYNGPCSHDPLGKDEIRAQQLAESLDFDGDSND